MADGDTPDTLAGAQDPAAMSEQTPIGGTPVNLPRPQQQQQPIRAPNLADYRMPLIAQLISGMANANKPMPNQQPGQPPMMRPSRLDAFEDFLGNFMYSLSQGMAASGHGPGANLRGAAAAIGAPMQRDVQQYGLNQNAANMQAQREAEQARTGLTQAETQKTGVDVQLLQRRLAMMQPGALDSYVKMSTISLGELSPDEQAQVDASKADAGMTGDFKPINAAVESIARNRAISGRTGQNAIVQDPDGKFYKEIYDRKGDVVKRTQVPTPAGYLSMTQGAAGPAVVNKLNAAPQGGAPARSVGLGAPSMGGITLVDRGNGPEYALKSQALGVAPGKPLDATERYKINTNDVAMVNAIQRMEGIYNNADVISSMLDAGKISFAIGADGTLQAAIGRGVKLTEREKTFAKDFQSMSEDINLLRLPMGGAGFRSEEAFAALQAQRGRLMQNPDVFKGVVGNSLKTLRELHEANQNALRTKSGGGGGGASNKGTPLTIDEARIYLNRAGGDKNKAREMAKAEGKSF